MNILVTGGAGYIGSIVVEELIRRGYSVIVLDNLYTGHRAAVHPQATFVYGDLADRRAVHTVFETYPIDAVMHFASYTLVAESMELPFKYLGENVTNGLNLLQEAVAHGVRRFILSSTANLFDQPRRIPIDEEEEIIPGSPTGNPRICWSGFFRGWTASTASGMRRSATSMRPGHPPPASGERIMTPRLT